MDSPRTMADKDLTMYGPGHGGIRDDRHLPPWEVVHSHSSMREGQQWLDRL